MQLATAVLLTGGVPPASKASLGVKVTCNSIHLRLLQTSNGELVNI